MFVNDLGGVVSGHVQQMGYGIQADIGIQIRLVMFHQGNEFRLQFHGKLLGKPGFPIFLP